LLSLPVRGDKVPFYHATTPDLLKELEDQLKMLLPEAKPLITALEGANQMQLGERPLLPSAGAVDEYEGAAYQEVDKRQVEKWINADLIEAPVAVFGAPQFRSVCERLPVLARNQLEQGISKNLFYEEIVPRRARFFFFIERPAACDYLHEALQQLGQRVQVGANATVGYGMCKIERIYTTQKNN
jgi:CRISPR-associated protein Cmr4